MFILINTLGSTLVLVVIVLKMSFDRSELGSWSQVCVSSWTSGIKYKELGMLLRSLYAHGIASRFCLHMHHKVRTQVHAKFLGLRPRLELFA
jgi:hypothetical protein